MSQALCCAHQPRIDSPEPPSRLPVNIDGIFAAAALPEDHPHALKFPEKKPGLDVSIIRSPGIASKIRLQFCRKSIKALRQDEEYDLDARPLTSTEVVNTFMRIADEKRNGDVDAAHELRLGSVRTLQTPSVQTERDPPATYVRPSVLKSFEWLEPLLDKLSDVSTIVSTDATHPSTVCRCDEIVATPILPQSVSSPSLIRPGHSTTMPLRRTQSLFHLSAGTLVPKRRVFTMTGTSPRVVSRVASFAPFDGAAEHSNTQSSKLERIEGDRPPTIHINVEDERPRLAMNAVPMVVAETNNTHLQNMDISHQLRSMSQLSDPADAVEANSLLSSDQPWNFHHRVQSDIGGVSARSRHSRQESSGIDSAIVPDAWGRVKSPAVSSIYSRGTSSGGDASHIAQIDGTVPSPYEIPDDLIATSVDWPLKPVLERETLESFTSTETCPLLPAGSVNNTQLSIPDGIKRSGSTSFATAANTEDASVKWLSPPERAASIPSKSSSSTLTKQSKTSRFLERFSPPRKTVRNRRSIFKFLRPGSRRQQPRSISSPVLREVTARPSGTFDGPSKDPALLSVYYELPEYHTKTTRSASMNNLTPHHKDVASKLGLSAPLQRRPTLADYERNLTATGDDRRRPSMINLHRLKEVQEDDHRHSVSLSRKLSRAKPLNEDTTGLMAQALQKHQEEKALFRSASKQRESLSQSRQTQGGRASGTTGISSAGTSLPSSSIRDYNGFTDPLTASDIEAVAGRRHSSGHLRPPRTTFAGPSKRTASDVSPYTVSAGQSIYTTTEQRPAGNRIGTSLTSWSRYPSHTRAERCGSAGRTDQIITRDFATDNHHADVHALDEGNLDTPGSKKSKWSVKSLPRSRSSVLMDVVRYYSHMFTTGGNTGQNRRTSVATSGWLAKPDLEMLPPVTSSEPRFPHHDYHLREHLHQLEHQLEEHVRHDVEQIEAEASKLIHHPYHHQQRFQTQEHLSRASSPFRLDSIFGPSSPGRLHRNSSFVGPSDVENEESMLASGANGSPAEKNNNVSQAHVASHLERGLTLDGVSEGEVGSKKPYSSKAEELSALYKACMIPHKSPDGSPGQDDVPLLPQAETDAKTMPPPTLKPVKPRSPEQPARLDPKASIRRFPSVTVVDDRKGHSRSVSLISVQVDHLGGIVRSSTNDLLQLIEAREREEREKLLKGVINNSRLSVAEMN